jgi:penicillin amidase
LLCRTRQPKTSGQIQVSGLQEPAEISWDQWGVPHIYASNLQDLMFAQGYIHAQQRLWQMEFNRRLVAGRLSEVFGALTVPVDRWLRTLTMRRVAESEESLLNMEIQEYLQAYADGVNAYIAQGPLPIEFSLLRYKPEAWIIPDTLCWIKMMAWGLSVNWEMEILRAQLIEQLGPELAAELEPPHLGRWPYILPPDTSYADIGASAPARAQAARPFSGPPSQEGLGSNNWVISGDLSATGMPLLANDMHLPIGIPSIWYENHLVCDELNIIGVTFPGIPGVISGHNGHVAWGYTNGFPDVQDLYIERLRRTEDGRVQAEYNGEWEEARILREVIQVKGGNSALEEVIVTRHGPIINQIAPEKIGESPLALRWTALEPDTMIAGIFTMMRAHDCREFHQALRNWTTPTQNVVYADTQGNIAYAFPGKTPLRRKGDGRIPVPGWTDEYEWTGYIPFEQLPHMLNPSRGFIATANNRVFDDNFPVRIEIEPISGDRAQRIVELITDQVAGNGSKIDITYIQRMHLDQQSPSAREVARQIGQLSADSSPTDPRISTVIRWMQAWDGTLAVDSKEAAVYQAFTRQLMRLILASKLTQNNGQIHESLIQFHMGKGLNPVLAETSLMGELWLPWLTHILEQATTPWLDLGSGENRVNLIHQALKGAIHELTEALGPDMETWAWGRIHQLVFKHVMGDNPILGAFFNRGPFPTGGDQSTVWATGSSYHDLSSDSFIGPPYRMIVDLGDLRNSVSMLAPGQSGIPTSPHYDDQIGSWFEGVYHPMLYERKDVLESSTQKLSLMPER